MKRRREEGITREESFFFFFEKENFFPKKEKLLLEGGHNILFQGILELADGLGCVGEKEGIVIGGTDIFQPKQKTINKNIKTKQKKPTKTHYSHVEVLSYKEEVHDIFWSGPLNFTAEFDNGILEAADDGLTLPRDADAREVFRFGIGFRRFDLNNFIGLGLFFIGFSQATGRVNFVHGHLHALIRINIRH